MEPEERKTDIEENIPEVEEALETPVSTKPEETTAEPEESKAEPEESKPEPEEVKAEPEEVKAEVEKVEEKAPSAPTPKKKKKAKKGEETSWSIVRKNVFTYFNLVFLIIAILLITARSYRSLSFLPIIFFNIAIGIFQQLRSKKVLDNLNVLAMSSYEVDRAGKHMTVPMDELEEGDILYLAGVGTQGILPGYELVVPLDVPYLLHSCSTIVIGESSGWLCPDHQYADSYDDRYYLYG